MPGRRFGKRMPPTKKRCPRCGRVLPAEAFNMVRGGRELAGWCRVCNHRYYLDRKEEGFVRKNPSGRRIAHGGYTLRSAGISTSDRERTGIREGALFLWLFWNCPAGGVKARGRCGNGDSGAAFPPFQQPAGRARNPPAIESAEKPSTWRKRGD